MPAKTEIIKTAVAISPELSPFNGVPFKFKNALNASKSEKAPKISRQMSRFLLLKPVLFFNSNFFSSENLNTITFFALGINF